MVAALTAPASAAVFPTFYPTGSAHLDITEVASGKKVSHEWPVYPPQSGARADLLQIGEVHDPFGYRPAQTEWFDNIGRMQFWFADLNQARPTPEGAAALLGIYGPLKLGTSEAYQSSALNVVVRLPGQPSGGENRSAAGGRCTVTIAGRPESELTGTVSCKKLTSIYMNGQIPQPPDIDLEATFTVQAGPAPSERQDVDVAIDHVEVVQVVQDAANTIPLVANKSTVARVFLRLNDGAPKNVLVKVELNGLRNGSLLRPPPTPVVTDMFLTPKPDRNLEGQGITFALPPAWVARGDLGLLATVTPLDPWHETHPDDNESGPTVEFFVRRPVLVAWVPVCFGATADKVPTDCPSESLMNEFPSVMQRMYPVPDNGVDFFRVPSLRLIWLKRVDTTANYSALLSYVDSRWDVARAFSAAELKKFPDFLVGITPDSGKPAWGGMAPNVGKSDTSIVTYSGTYAYSAMAHEIGHDLGLHHTAKGVPPCDTSKDPSSDWSRTDASTGEIGWDVVNNKFIPADWNDLMSYCGTSTQWISPFHYRKLFVSEWNPFGPQVAGRSLIAARSGTAGLPAAAAQPTDAYLVVSGTVQRDLRGGTLNAAFTVPSPQAPPDILASDSGQVCLVTLAAGIENGRRCFEPAFVPTENDGTELSEATFSVVVPAPANLTELRLVADDRTLATVVAGAAPPTVKVQAGGAQTWSTPQTLQWAATAAPGRSPVTMVLYSPDGGHVWFPFADAPGVSVDVDPTQLVAGSGNMFRVLVSDGLATASADVGPITVPEGVGRAPLPTRDEVPPPDPAALPTPPPGAATAAPGAPTVPPGGPSPTPAAPRDGVPLAFLVLAVVLVIGGGFAVFLLARGRTRAAAPAAGWGQSPGPWSPGPPPVAPWQGPAPGTLPPGQAPPGAWQQGQPPPAAWQPAPQPWGQGPPGPWTAARPGPDLNRPAAMVLAILGAADVLLFGVVVAAAGSVKGPIAGPDPAFVLGVAFVGVAVGVLAIVGAALAWRGSVVGRAIGLVFAAVAAFFSAAAVVEPIPGVPPALSVIAALAVLAGSLFVAGAFLFAWRPLRR